MCPDPSLLLQPKSSAFHPGESESFRWHTMGFSPPVPGLFPITQMCEGKKHMSLGWNIEHHLDRKLRETQRLVLTPSGQPQCSSPLEQTWIVGCYGKLWIRWLDEKFDVRAAGKAWTNWYIDTLTTIISLYQVSLCARCVSGHLRFGSLRFYVQLTSFKVKICLECLCTLWSSPSMSPRNMFEKDTTKYFQTIACIFQFSPFSMIMKSA